MRFLSLLMLFAVFCFSACTTAEPTSSDPLQQGKLIYGLTLNVSGIDPHINQSSELGIVLRQVYDTLVYRHPTTRQIVPGLATAWTISDDQLTYTFELRDDVRFHDGTPFNAAAVVANLERIINPETNSQRARLLLGPLAGYQIEDDYTIRLILAEPYSPFLDALSQVYVAMASPQALAEHSLLRYQYHQVGTGPFVFVEYLPEDRIVIRRNPDYAWGPEFYTELAPNAVQEIEFRFFRDPATRGLALESGAAHIMGEVSPVDARAFSNSAAFGLLPANVPGQPLQFYFNTRLAPTNELAVRQALLYATNRTAIVETVYQGFSPVAWGPISATSLFYNPGVRGVYDYNLDQARLLLSNAGYQDSDNDGFLERGGQVLEITIVQPPWGLVPEVVQLIQDQWRAIGIRANIEPVPGFTALIEKVRSGQYHLVSFDTFGLDPAILNPRFLSNGEVNWTGYANPELDQALIAATGIADSEQRRLLYGRIQAIIMEQALILPIRDYVNINAYNRRVQGLVFDPYGWFPLLYNVTIAPAS